MGAIIVIIMSMDPASFVLSHYLICAGMCVAVALILPVFCTRESVLEYVGMAILWGLGLTAFFGLVWMSGAPYAFTSNATVVFTAIIWLVMLGGLDSLNSEPLITRYSRL
jgi:hypothetical protein